LRLAVMGMAQKRLDGAPVALAMAR